MSIATKRHLLPAAILMTVLACSFEYIPPPAPAPTLGSMSSAAPQQEEEPPIFPSRTSPPPSPTFTPAPPTFTRVPTRTPTPLVPMVMSPDANIYCRVGPSLDWAIDGILERGRWVGAYGQDASGEWYQIATPNFPGRYCFVSKALIKATGNLKKLPFVPTPQALVTALNVELLPTKVTIACASLPYTFEVRVEITTNGPSRVTFQRSFDNGNAEPPETVSLSTSGVHIFKYPYKVKTAGSHWVLIELYAPNFRTSKDTATLSCTP